MNLTNNDYWVVRSTSTSLGSADLEFSTFSDASNNNHMEEYRNQVIKLHATCSKIISKFTSNISKNTSKSTSKTNWIRLGGHGGGHTPY